MFLEIDDDIDAEVYAKKTYERFHTNMNLILKILPDTGLTFNDFMNSEPKELYEKIIKIDTLNNLFNKYVLSLKKSDMLLISLTIDYTINKDENPREITNMIQKSNDKDIYNNFILVCVIWIKHVFIPITLSKKNKSV